MNNKSWVFRETDVPGVVKTLPMVFVYILTQDHWCSRALLGSKYDCAGYTLIELVGWHEGPCVVVSTFVFGRCAI